MICNRKILKNELKTVKTMLCFTSATLTLKRKILNKKRKELELAILLS